MNRNLEIHIFRIVALSDEVCAWADKGIVAVKQTHHFVQYLSQNKSHADFVADVNLFMSSLMNAGPTQVKRI